MLQAGILAAIISGLAVVSLVLQYGQGAIWSHLTTIFLIAPSALVGGWFATRR